MRTPPLLPSVRISRPNPSDLLVCFRAFLASNLGLPFRDLFRISYGFLVMPIYYYDLLNIYMLRYYRNALLFSVVYIMWVSVEY